MPRRGRGGVDDGGSGGCPRADVALSAVSALAGRGVSGVHGPHYADLPASPLLALRAERREVSAAGWGCGNKVARIDRVRRSGPDAGRCRRQLRRLPTAAHLCYAPWITSSQNGNPPDAQGQYVAGLIPDGSPPVERRVGTTSRAREVTPRAFGPPDSDPTASMIILHSQSMHSLGVSSTKKSVGAAGREEGGRRDGPGEPGRVPGSAGSTGRGGRGGGDSVLRALLSRMRRRSRRRGGIGSEGTAGRCRCVRGLPTCLRATTGCS
jgi:hypothetical protein